MSYVFAARVNPAAASRDESAREVKAIGMAAPGMAGEEDDGDEASVGSVAVVAPRLRRYRAVVVRSVSEQAVVEFDALETDPQHELAEAVAAKVPAGSWVRREGSGCGQYAYLDKVEDIGPVLAPAAVADPAEAGDDLETMGGAKSTAAPEIKGTYRNNGGEATVTRAVTQSATVTIADPELSAEEMRVIAYDAAKGLPDSAWSLVSVDDIYVSAVAANVEKMQGRDDNGDSIWSEYDSQTHTF